MTRPRQFLNGLTFLSIGLLVLTLAAWIVGAIHPFTFSWAMRSDRAFFSHFGRGRILFVEQKMFPPNPPRDFVVDATQFHILSVRGALENSGATISYDPLVMLSNNLLGPDSFAGLGVVHSSPGFLLNFRKGMSTRVAAAVGVAAAPYWILMLVFLIPPGIRLYIRHRDRLKVELGLCKICGYDLRATPLRCPECGTVPETPLISAHAGDLPPQTAAENPPPSSA
jgi:hypothetical protein